MNRIYRIIERLDGKFYMEYQEQGCSEKWVPFTNGRNDIYFAHSLEEAKKLLNELRVESGDNPIVNTYEIA